MFHADLWLCRVFASFSLALHISTRHKKIHSKQFVVTSRMYRKKISYANSPLALWREFRKSSFTQKPSERAKKTENSRMKTANSLSVRFSWTLQPSDFKWSFLFLSVQCFLSFSASIYYCVAREKWKYFYFVSPVECLVFPIRSQKTWLRRKVDDFLEKLRTETLSSYSTREANSHVSVNSFSCQNDFFSLSKRHRQKSFFKSLDEKSYTH